MKRLSDLFRRLLGKTESGGPFHSAFGGLWTDRLDARQEAERRHQAGALSDGDLRDLLAFIEDGYVILPQAVDVDLALRVIDEVETRVRDGRQLMTWWDDDGHHKETGSLEALHKREAKVLDVHKDLESAQEAIFSERIRRFLTNAFEMPAVAFQTLYFHRGSEQGFHQDTAFVYVDRPLHFAASWIALEDIGEGSGELQYYAGSHRLPDENFPVSRSKALLPEDPSTEHYSASLERKCEEAGLEKRSFCPRKGDVLIWSADLVHGGAPIHNDRTRRSLVTHYCPENTNPPYARVDRRKRTAVLGHWIMSAH